MWLRTWRSGPKNGPDKLLTVLVSTRTIPESGTVVDFGRNGAGRRTLPMTGSCELGKRPGALVVDRAVLERVQHQYRRAMHGDAIDEVDSVADVDERRLHCSEHRRLIDARLDAVTTATFGVPDVAALAIGAPVVSNPITAAAATPVTTRRISALSLDPPGRTSGPSGRSVVMAAAKRGGL